jgi:hypothetical protein
VVWRIDIRTHETELAFLHYSSLWNYFAVGAPVSLCSNINPLRGLANGTWGHLHSITFTSDQRKIQFESDYDSTPPGSIITLDPQAVHSVNVKFPKKSLHSLSILTEPDVQEEQDSVIVPLKKFRSFEPCVESKLIESKSWDYELCFAVTAHKAQGKTMDAIVDINKCAESEFDRAMLLVALSRVTSSNNLRILPLIPPVMIILT